MGKTALLLDASGKPMGRTGGMNRYVNSGLSNGAASLKDPSFATWEWHGGDADGDIVENIEVVRQRTRDLCLNAPVVAGLVNTIVTNVIGQGLIPEPTPDMELLGFSQEEAAAWKRHVLRYWEAWAESKSCDVRGDLNFYEQTQLVLRSEIESGDVFAGLPLVEKPGTMFDLKIQLIEADCVCNPSLPKPDEIEGDVLGGVEVGRHGEVLAYHIATKHPLSHRTPFMYSRNFSFKPEWVRVPVLGEESGRQNILHIKRTLRPGQRRGVSILAPVVKTSKMLDRYIAAELQASIVNTLFTMAVKTNSPDMTAGQFDAMGMGWGDGNYATPSQKFYEENGFVQMGTGTVTFLAPGDDVTPIGVAHPQSGFAAFCESQLKLMGAAVGVPYELLLMTFNASYSASRAALNMAQAGFKTVRDHITYDFCQPVYEAFMAECVAAGYIDAPGFFMNPLIRRAYCTAKWNGPGSLQIDPVKEVDAAIKRASVGISTLQQETSEMNGGDWTQNAGIRHAEQAIIDKAPWDPNMNKIGRDIPPQNEEGGETDAESIETDRIEDSGVGSPVQHRRHSRFVDLWRYFGRAFGRNRRHAP